MRATQGICPLVDFKRDSARAIAKIRKTGRPQVLTVDGSPSAIVPDAAVWEEMRNLLDYAETAAVSRLGRVFGGMRVLLDYAETAAGIRKGLNRLPNSSMTWRGRNCQAIARDRYAESRQKKLTEAWEWLKEVPTTLSASDIDTMGTFTVCYFPDTLVATPSGERRVEHLVAGDMLLAADGRAVPTKWIGRQTVSTRFGPAERLMPVRFSAGSLGEGLPQGSLTVTPDHAVLLDGVLCQASALANETTITRVPLPEFGETYTVYHVEADAHEIIFANGAPAETFVDTVSRKSFDNYAEFEALFGENPPEMVEQPHPRAANARQLPARIRNRLRIGETEQPGKFV